MRAKRSTDDMGVEIDDVDNAFKQGSNFHEKMLMKTKRPRILYSRVQGLNECKRQLKGKARILKICSKKP